MALLFFLSACGGGSGDGGQSDLIPGGSAGGDASTLSDDQILQKAADNAAGGLNVNLGGIARLADDAQDSDSAVVGSLTDGDDTVAINELDNSADNFLVNSLGLNDAGAMINRDGNLITIDPDDQTLCGDEIPLAADLNDSSNCVQLMSDLMVEVDAQSDETGVISYLFQNSPVLLIGYAPAGASFELNLGGLLLVAQRANELDGNTSAMNSILSGAVRLEAMVLNDEPGTEAGTLALKVTEAIRIGEIGSPEELTLQPSTVFGVEFDEATQDVSMEVDWGALQVVVNENFIDDDPSITSFNLGGLTAEINANPEQPSFRVSNIGIGGVPLTVTVDSVESLNLTLANFGISINEQTDTITLDGALNARLMLDNLNNFIEDQASDFFVNASISAPAATRLTPQENGSTQVSGGGPVSATLNGGDGTSTAQSDVMISEGECFDSDSDDESNEVTSLIVSVSCD